MTKTQEDFVNKIFTSHFIARVWEGCVGFYCERELEFNPKVMAVSVVSFSFSRAAQPEPWSPLCWVLVFLLSLPPLVHLPLQLYWTVLFCSIRRPYITFKLPRGDMDTPPQFLPISGDRDVSLPLSLEWPVWSSSSGNNGHSLPVRQSMRV